MNTRILKGIGLSVALSLAVVLLLVATPVSAQTFTWDGGGTTDNWSDSGNWGGSAISESGDAILVYDGTTRLNSVKDVNGGSGGYNIDNITFNSTAGAFVLSETSGGTGIDMLGVRDPSLTAAITNNSSNTQTIALKVIARGSPYTAGTEFNTAVGNINVTGVVASLEGAGIVKTGTGTLYLSGNNTYSGSTAINQGVVRISSNTALGTTAAGTTVDQSTNARLELTGGITVAEDITFVNTSSGLSTTLRNVSGDNEISGLVTLPGSIRVGSNGGSLEFSGGVSGANTFFVVNSSGGTTSFTTNPINIGTGTFYVDSGGLTTLAVAGNTWNSTTFTSGTLRMGIANALPSNTTFRHSGLSYGTGGTLDLNGYDQTIASLYTDSNLANAVGSTITSATAATLTVNQTANTTYYGTFSGVVGLTKTGTGTLTLGGNSTYDTSNTSTGLTTVSDGVLAMNKQNGALAISGDILINGGRLSWSTSHQVADTSSITVDSGVLWVGQSETVANVTINSAPTVSGYSFHLLNGLNVTGTLTVAAGDAIAGSGGSATANAVNMTGGRLAMAANTGNSTITIGGGGLTMSGATVQLGYDGGSSTAQVNLGGDFTGSGTNNISYVNTSGPRLLDLGGATRTFNVTSGTTTINPTIQNGALTKTGSGTLVLAGAIPNTYTGLTTVDGGTLTLNKTSGVNAVAGDIVVNSGTLFLNNHHQIADTASIVVNGSANFNNNQRTETVANVTLNSSYSDPNNHRVSNMTITGALTITDGVVGLNSGTNTTVGTLDMSGGSRMDFAANTGSTILNVGSGGLTMGGATLRLGWNGLTSPHTAQVNLDGDFTGSGTNSLTYLTTNASRLLNLQGATRSFDVTSGTTTVDLTIQNGGLTKIGDGTLLLNAVNTYTGTTTVSAGTLGGDGSIAGAVLVEGTGTLSPGNSPGILTLNDGLTFTGGTYEVDIEGTTAGTGYDQVVVTSGNVDLGLGVADLLLNVDSGFSPAIDDYLWIIDNTGSGTTSGYFTGLDDGSSVDVNGRRFYVYYNADHDTAALSGGNDVLLTSVPEPSTLAMLLGLAGIGLMGWMRRRR